VSALATAPTDQRGRARISGGGVDIGAVEMTTFLVTNVNNTGTGSLRSAINLANAAGSGDVLFSTLFDTSKFITLTSGEIQVTGSLNITGPTVPGNLSPLVNITQIGGGRIFNLAPAAAATMSFRNLTLLAGNTSANLPADQDGGNILVSANADATFRDCIISGGNCATADGGNFRVLFGGILRTEDCRITSGIAWRGGNCFNGGEIQLKRSFLGNGHASTRGGGLCNLASGGLTNCTFSGNEALGDGGGIYNLSAPAVMLDLRHCTIANNRANTDNTGSDSGGGIRRFSGIVSLKNCLIQENQLGNAALAPRDDISGVLTTLGNNLIGTGFTNGVPSAEGDITGTPAIPWPSAIGELGFFGGRTELYSIGCNSAALDAGDDSGATATDQRGLPRRSGDAVDIGSYELQPESYDFWVGYHFNAGATLTGQLDDKDGDGTVNGLEYVFGLNPTSRDQASALIAIRDGDTFTLRVPISPLSLPTSYRVEFSTNLLSWNLAPETTVVESATTAACITDFSLLLPGEPAAFGRIVYIPQP